MFGESPTQIAEEIGEQGAGKLKQITAEVLNIYFKEIKKKRSQLEKDKFYVRNILRNGINVARKTAVETLSEVLDAMNMKF